MRTAIEPIGALTQNIASDFCAKHGIRYLALFGSYARGDFGPESDVDFLVEYKKKKTLLDVIGDELDMSDILGKKVQFVEIKTLPGILAPVIEREKKVLHEER